MTPGSRPRRIATRAAGGVVAALLLTLGGGCQSVPVGRVAAANRPKSTLGTVGRAALLPATVALEAPAEMGSIDPSNSARGTVTPASAIGAGPKADLIATEGATGRSDPDEVAGRPTPLLDDALVRAKRRGDVPDPAEPTGLANLPQPAPPLPPAADPSAAAATVPSITVDPPVMIAPPPLALDPRPSSEAPPTPTLTPEAAHPAADDPWRDGVRKLVGLARARQDQAGAGGAAGAEPWGLRARVLAWLAEPDIDPDLGQHDADVVRAVLRALQATAAPGDAHPRADDVRAAVETLEARAPLELVDLQLCSRVDGFGDFAPFDPPTRRAGDWVILYCEVDGVHHEPTAGGLQTRVAGQLEIIPDGGGPAIIHPLGTAPEVFPRRRRDYYINFKKQIPRDLPPGSYTVRVTVRDLATERTSSRSTALTIVPGREPAEIPREPDPTP